MSIYLLRRGPQSRNLGDQDEFQLTENWDYCGRRSGLAGRESGPAHSINVAGESCHSEEITRLSGKSPKGGFSLWGSESCGRGLSLAKSTGSHEQLNIGSLIFGSNLYVLT